MISGLVFDSQSIFICSRSSFGGLMYSDSWCFWFVPDFGFDPDFDLDFGFDPDLTSN